MKVMITGITGFAGSHLADFLLDRGLEVIGTIRWRSPRDNIRHLEGRVGLYECDLKDYTAVEEVIRVVRPDMIFHLSAQSFVPASWRLPAETLSNNIISELNLFEAVRKVGINPRIQIAGSSEEYGYVRPDEVPIGEEQPLRPLSPYAVSKVAQDMLGYQYYRSYGLQIVRTRAFNHTGPRRGEVFVISNFAKQIAEIELGMREPVIYVGNLDAVRDFTDVRDTVRAYYLVLERGKAGEVYNIATGRGYRIGDLLDKLLSMSSVKVEVRQDPERMRPSDVELLIGDATKLRKETGWEPEIPIEKTLEDTLNYWREKLKKL